MFAARADLDGALAALTALVRGLELDRERLTAAAADPLLLATDAAEGSCARRCRSATRTSRSQPRCGTGATTRARGASRPAPGPGGAAEAVAAARERLESV